LNFVPQLQIGNFDAEEFLLKKKLMCVCGALFAFLKCQNSRFQPKFSRFTPIHHFQPMKKVEKFSNY
jgi:hypothetical protein